MQSEVMESFCEEETAHVGEQMARQCLPGTVVTLNGDLAAGKTVFTKGFGRGLGITEPINSPTFTVMQVYEGGRLGLYHFDVYRIADIEEMEEIGYEEFFYGDGVCLIEWAELIEDILPPNRIDVTIRKDYEKGDSYRRIEVQYTEPFDGLLSGRETEPQ